MKFPDLNFDCLESVLEYLGLIDLLNVADSTKRLRKAAELVFSRKFSDKTVTFGAMKITPDKSFRVTEESIQIKCLKTSLQLLRCVGCVVTRIIFDAVIILKKDLENQCEMDRKLFTYINNYCAEYLKEIFIEPSGYSKRGSSKYFDKPFTKIVRLSIVNYICEKSCLERIFPKLQELNLYSPENVSFHTNRFPHLQKLMITELGGSPFQNEMVSAFLQLNPQIKELVIWSKNLNMNLIQSAVDSLQNIKTLTLAIKPMTSIQDSENFIHMKSVKVFEIGFWYLDEMPLYFLPFSFEQLDKFSITFPEAEFHSAFIQQFYNFIDKHSTIARLLIGNIGSSGAVNWSRLAEKLPLMVTVRLYGCRFSTDEAIEIMAKFQILKQFEFQLTGEYDHFRKRLDNKWEAAYQSDDNLVTLKRRI